MVDPPCPTVQSDVSSTASGLRRFADEHRGDATVVAEIDGNTGLGDCCSPAGAVVKVASFAVASSDAYDSPGSVVAVAVDECRRGTCFRSKNRNEALVMNLVGKERCCRYFACKDRTDGMLRCALFRLPFFHLLLSSSTPRLMPSSFHSDLSTSGRDGVECFQVVEMPVRNDRMCVVRDEGMR